MDEGQATLEVVQDSMSETERSERMGTRKKQNPHKQKKEKKPKKADKENDSTKVEGKTEMYKAENKNEMGKDGQLYPSLEKLGLYDADSTGESSDSDTLDPAEEADLEEEAARYEADRYYPDENSGARLQMRSFLKGASPSAPPPPYVPSGAPSKRYSLLPEKVRRKLKLTFPVFETEGGGCIHAPVDFTQLKELAKSIRKYGPNASFTLVQLDRLATNALTPADWQMIVQAALPSMGQYMEWKALWQEAAQAQARVNGTALTPEQREWTSDLLTGQGAYAADQTNYHWGAYAQVAATAIKAWKALSKKGEANNQLTKIIQGPQEPFSDFVARMTEATGRIFGDTGPIEPFIQQLIFEQATQECRAAIAPRKSKGLQDWLRVCRELWGPLTNAGLAAAILQTQKGLDKARKVCYGCGKPGHIKRNCPRNTEIKETPALCSCCGKGYHRASVCRSVRDLKGRLLPPLEDSVVGPTKNGVMGPRSQGPQKYGAGWVRRPTKEEGASPGSTQDDHADWTSAPPPTSY